MMGSALAANAQRAGQSLALLIRSQAARHRLAPFFTSGESSHAGHCLACDTPAEVAAQADLIVLCVTGAPEVEQVIFGDNGVLTGVRPGSVVLDCSTSLPATSRRVAAALAARGAVFLDAPMTGTPAQAEQGAVNLLVGGDIAVLDQVRSRLSAFSRNILHCGDIGAGHTLKLLHNFIVLGNAAILAEAFALAKREAVSMPTLCDVIASGGANSVAFDRLRPYVREGDDSSFRFSLANALKDMNYYSSIAAGQGAPMAGAVQGMYRAAGEAGFGNEFVPHLLDMLMGQGPGASVAKGGKLDG